MRCLWIALIAVALITGCGKQIVPPTPSTVSSWAPPQNPDPQTILNEAQSDAKAGNYADALAKHVWFFQNALKYDQGEYGVRLSFALSYWVDLGKVYPPALEKLKSFRDAAETNVSNDKNARDNFDDFDAINKELGENSKTADLFVWLDSNKPDSAKTVFDLAEPSLIESKRYPLIGKYTQNPFQIYDSAFQDYEMNTELAKKPEFGKRLQDFTDNEFKNETTTLIAILVVTDRKAIAEKIAGDLEKTHLPQDNKQIQKALNGEVPKPWP